MPNSNKAVKSAFIIVIFSLGSKFLGFIRESLIAAKFGSSMESDAFFVALTATGLISKLLITTNSTTFIPVLAEIEVKEGRKDKVIHTNNMINIITLFSIILVILAWFFSPLIISITAKGFYGKQFELAVQLNRIGLPMILFSGVIGSLTGFLQSEQKYMSTAAIGFPLNFVYIFFLILPSSQFDIRRLMVVAVVAVMSQLLVQIPEARNAGFRYSFIFDIKDEYIKKVLYLSMPVLMGVAINDINAIVDRTLASDLVTGSISALNYGNKLNGLVQGVFVSAITIVIYPILSRESNRDNISGMKKILAQGVNLILLVTIPATVGLVVLARPIVEVAFQRGAFTSNDTIMTTQALIFYSVGLVADSLRLLITKVYYSLQDTKTPMINGVMAVGFNIILNLILVKYMAHRGLALATSIATTVATLILLYGLKRNIGSLGTVEYIKCGLKSVLASSIMGVVVYMIHQELYVILGVSQLNNFISLLVAVGLGVVVYGILCYLFGVDEVRKIVGKVISRLVKR